MNRYNENIEKPHEALVANPATRQILISEREELQRLSLISNLVNRFLFTVLGISCAVVNGFIFEPVYAFSYVAAILTVVWLWEMIFFAARLRNVSDLITQLSHPENNEWTSAFIKSGYLLQYGSSPVTSSKWRMVEPILWAALVFLSSLLQ